MSKVWKNPITIPQWVTVKVDASVVSISGPKWSITHTVPPQVSIIMEDNALSFACDVIDDRKLWWTTRAIIAHKIHGVHEWYAKTLQVMGVGFDANMQWTNTIAMKLWFSHPVNFTIPTWITAKIEKDPKGNALIYLSSHDKQLIGQVAANIRALKKPEPYKWKGIRYFGEVIKLKAGKSAKK